MAPTEGVPADATASRLAWADAARGAAMMLVVYAHAVQLLGASGWSLGLFDTANVYLTAIRMPLFFLISGVFAVRAVRRSWPRLVASRLALLAYVYVLWMLLRAVWFSFVQWPLDDLHPWLALLVSPVWPTNGLWFLFALIAYLVVAKATLGMPRWIPLAAFGAISVATASGVLPTGDAWTWRSVLMYAFFFLLGVHGAELWRRLAARANLGWAALAVLAIAGGIAGFTMLPAPLVGVGRIGLSIACVASCIVLASLVSRVGWLASPFTFVGRRTLPVYVVHAILLAAIVPLVPAGAVPAWVAVGGFTAVGVVVPLVLNRWLGPPRGGVFALPVRLRDRLAAWADRRDARAQEKRIGAPSLDD